jgi:hypothetical protein
VKPRSLFGHRTYILTLLPVGEGEANPNVLSAIPHSRFGKESVKSRSFAGTVGNFMDVDGMTLSSF